MPTTLTRWDPFAELRGRVDRMFDELSSENGGRTWTPAIDVVRDGDALVLRADIPGLRPEEVKIEVEDDVLTVSGAHEEHRDEEDAHYIRRERRSGAFSRSMALPAGIDPKRIEATTQHGVVEVTIPLPKPAARETVTITPTAG